METPWKFHREGRGERKASNTKTQEHRMMVTVQQSLGLFRIYLNSTRFLQHRQAGLSVYLWQEEQWLALGPKPGSVRNPVFQSQSVLAYFSSKLLLEEVSTPPMEVRFHWGHPWKHSVQLPPYIFTNQTPQLHAITRVFNVAPTTIKFILKWFRKAEESKLICII